jgi:Fe-S-cluster-containing dehydrogenase component
MKILSTPRMERCIGCHSCSLACARLELQDDQRVTSHDSSTNGLINTL